MSGGDYGSCFGNSLTATSLVDGAIPPAGDGFFYLKTVTDGGGESSLGNASDGTPRTVASSCP